jgi:hypothetical protein
MTRRTVKFENNVVQDRGQRAPVKVMAARSLVIARSSFSEVILISMSITGCADIPGIAVPPTCLILI